MWPFMFNQSSSNNHNRRSFVKIARLENTEQLILDFILVWIAHYLRTENRRSYLAQANSLNSVQINETSEQRKIIYFTPKAKNTFFTENMEMENVERIRVMRDLKSASMPIMWVWYVLQLLFIASDTRQ